MKYLAAVLGVVAAGLLCAFTLSNFQLTVNAPPPPVLSLTINGSATPGQTLTAGGTMKVAASGGPGNQGDQIYVCDYNDGCGPTNGMDYDYLNCTKTAPGTPYPTATPASGCTMNVPNTPSSSYYMLFQANTGTSSTRLITLNFSVGASNTSPQISGVTVNPTSVATGTAYSGTLATQCAPTCSATPVYSLVTDATKCPTNNNATFSLSGTTLSFSAQGSAGTLVACVQTAVSDAGNTPQHFPVSVQITSGSTPTITVNGSSTGTSVAAGASMTVAVTNGPGHQYDFMSVCNSNANPLFGYNCASSGMDYDYLNCTQQPPTATPYPVAATCTLTAPSSAGSYFVNFLYNNNNQYNLLASAPLTVTGGGGGGGALTGSILPNTGTWTNLFDDEFNSSGAPGTFASGATTGDATTGIDWTQWFIGGEGHTANGYAINGPNTDIVRCSGTIWEAGGYLHITTSGTVGAHQGTVANPGYGCELYHPTGGWRGQAMYWESKGNQDNNLNPQGWSSLGWLCCGHDNVFAGGWEIDVMEIGTSGQYGGEIFWNNYAPGDYQQIISVRPTPPGFHVSGIYMSKTTGTTLYVDGTNMGSANPWGCSGSTPCTFDPQQFIFNNALLDSSLATPSTVGTIVDWARIYYQ